MDSDARTAALDDLAGALRERLIAEAGGADGDLHGRIRALVDREAALLDAPSRAELVARVSGRSGWGRWSRCCASRRSTR